VGKAVVEVDVTQTQWRNRFTLIPNVDSIDCNIVFVKFTRWTYGLQYDGHRGDGLVANNEFPSTPFWHKDPARSVGCICGGLKSINLQIDRVKMYINEYSYLPYSVQCMHTNLLQVLTTTNVDGWWHWCCVLNCKLRH
jgi:hypothetical protein